MKISSLSYKILQDQGIILVDKPIGATPLECVKFIKQENEKITNTRIGYAGRLDPMASGLLLLLIGEENKNKVKYENLSKEYIVEVLFGLSTDSQDLMGLITGFDSNAKDQMISNDLIQSFVGTTKMQYPAFSSKRLDGKPLFYHAHHGNISDGHEVFADFVIQKIDLLESKNISMIDVWGKISDIIPQVNGQFRQEEILEKYRELFGANKTVVFPTVKICVNCNSGV
ncbi:MAG: hypothetical protein U0525_06255, partial [Patescibacteria group bacterium]